MENIFGLDAMAALTLTGLVMGGTEVIRRLSKKDYAAAGIVLFSAAIGGVASPMLGINILQGVAYGLAASGYVTLAQNVGKRSLSDNDTEKS